MRRAAKADISQPGIVSALRHVGDKVDIIGRPVDLLIRTLSIYWTAEVKTPGNNAKRRMPAQVEHDDDARAHGAPHFVLLSIDDAMEIRNRLVRAMRG